VNTPGARAGDRDGRDVGAVGWKHVARLEENSAALGINLTSDQVARLSAVDAPVGDR